jgi:hypothetical protein
MKKKRLTELEVLLGANAIGQGSGGLVSPAAVPLPVASPAEEGLTSDELLAR